MSDQGTMFGGAVDDRHPWQRSVLESPGQARHTDPDTSKDAARLIRAKATSARVLLLQAHRWIADTSDGVNGLTDEEAARIADLSLSSEYATRCSELRRGGFLETTGETRRGQAGAERDVSRITALGRWVLEQREAS